MDARTLTLALQGTWHGRWGQAACPNCQPERRPDQHALSIRDRTDGSGPQVHCFKSDCKPRDILRGPNLQSSGVRHGLLAARVLHPDGRTSADHQRQAERRAQQAQRLWQGTQRLQGTLVEVYLQTRGITCLLPPTLRFHPACFHVSGQRLPALVALVEGGKSFAVHRTYIRPDGSGKAAIKPHKAMLGRVAGGAVRLAPAGPRLMVGEGLETCLSAMQATGGQPTWAALSTSGLRSLVLPDEVRELIILADGDHAGEAAAQAAALRWRREGWQVRIARPPEGQDFNDLLRPPRDFVRESRS